ncbi:MAG: hypothetical protein V7K57_10345 [Nostoc sp.]|uniref:hypothetical protein n=1 Tax=Nostoc sp. TaxID=1180 RepID=UPI002FF7C581
MIIRQFLALAAISLTLASCGQAASNPNLTAQNPPQAGERSPQGRRSHRQIDFTSAAQKLGVTEAKLKEALGVPTNSTNPPDGERRRPDLKAAATKLGVTEEKLREALGIPARPSSNPSS